MNPFIVAEIGGNHLGSLDKALALVNLAATAGADAVKIQCFTPEQMAEPGVKLEAGPWAGRDLLDLYRETHTPRAWHIPIFDYASKVGIKAFASVFHRDDVDWMETLGCPIYKIASFELTDSFLVNYVAWRGKPVIVSTGMATERDIRGIVARTAQMTQDPVHYSHWSGPTPKPVPLTLLKCTSGYPAPLEQANILTMVDMGAKFKCAVGLSDHTLGHTAAVVATALGANMIEKHLIRDRSDGGADADFSANPYEFAALVKECRAAASAAGTVQYGPTESEMAHLGLRRKPGGKRGQ